MKRAITTIAAALVLAAGATPSAGAQAVQYGTVYSFMTDGMGNPIFSPFNPLSPLGLTATNTYGSATLTFVGQPLTDVFAPTVANLGTVSYTGGFTFNGTQQVFLEIVQYVPSSGSATVVGGLNGTLTSTSTSDAYIDWNSGSTGRFATITNGNVSAKYELERAANGGSGGGFTSISASQSGPSLIQGYVTVSPEPASMTLLATGLIGIFGAARRRRKNVVA